MQPITGKPEEEGPKQPGARSRGMSMAELREKWTHRSNDPKSKPSRSGPGGPKLLVGGLGLAALIVGWLISTRILLPAPAAPGDLVEVPSLSGEDLSSVEAELARVGLSLASVDSVGHAVVPAGIVFGQTPLAGQLAAAGGEVRVTISVGAVRVAVPDVKGAQAEEARRLLATAGFSMVIDTIDSRRPRGEVISQSPTAGQRVAPPLDVRLSVSQGPPTVEMPNLVQMSEDGAIEVLDSLGLDLLEIEERFRFGQDQGQVLEQNPAAGEVVELGSGVRLVVGRRRR